MYSIYIYGRIIGEFLYLIQILAFQSMVLFIVEVHEMLQESYKQGINDRAERMENILKGLKEVNNTFRKRGYRAGSQMKSSSAERKMLSKSEMRNSCQNICPQQYKAKIEKRTWMTSTLCFSKSLYCFIVAISVTFLVDK